MRQTTFLVLISLALLAHPAHGKGDAPEISRSAGVRGGVVVFWPRVIPREMTPVSREVAASIQRHLVSLVRKTVPGRPIDARPEPERVCRKAGCEAMTVGALLARKKDSCVLVALISAPGRAPAALIPWVGGVELKRASAAFRDPPESEIKITDFFRCDEIVAGLANNEDRITEAVRATAAAISPPP